MPLNRVVIKKYENRRLYDTANSRYVNLDEVAQMVRDGTDVQVIDASTGEDITRLILTQIIAENAKGQDSAFPLDILRQMVMNSGRASQETLLKNMKAMFQMYQNAYRAFSPALTSFDFMQTIMGSPGAENPAAPENAPASPAEKPSEMEELRRRIEELEKQRPPRRKRKRG